MEWWQGILAFCSVVLIAGLVPWTIQVRLATGEGIYLELRFAGRLTILALRGSFGEEAKISFAGISFTIKLSRGQEAGSTMDEGSTNTGSTSTGSRHDSSPAAGGTTFRRRQHLEAALRALTTDTFLVLGRYFLGIIGNAKRSLEVVGEFGLGDPGYTGIAYGLVCGVLGAAGVDKADIRPSFFELTARGRVVLEASVRPVIIVVRTLLTVFHPAVMRVWFRFLVPPGTAKTEEVHSIGP